MQGKIEKPVVKKEKKEDEKKEVKEAPKEVAAVATESKKKQKKSDWVTKEVKPQRVKPEETEQKEEEKKPEKKDKRGDKKGGKRGDKKQGDKKGDKKEEEGEPKEKSIYKVFKPHGAEAEKVEAKTEEKKEETAVVEEEKKEKKERNDRPQKPRLKMKYNAYKSSEDFWETNIADSYVEPAEITTVSPVPTEEKAEKKEKKEKGGKKGEQKEPAPAVQIKVNKQVSLARTDPWAKTDSSAQATTSDSDEYFPALGEKNAKKPKKVNKASETEPTVASPQKKSDSHKREANDTLFEYNAEAPADKKIKLGEEVEQNNKEEETFVLPSE
jgi:hypothetical protein